MQISYTGDIIPKPNILVYGESGIGKTYAISTAPNPIVISSEKGLITLKKFNIPYIEIETSRDIDKAISLAIKGKYETICLDSISDIAEQWLSEFKQGMKDNRQAYDKINTEIGRLIRALRRLDVNTYIVSKLIREVDEITQAISYRPWMPGKTLNVSMPYFFDCVLLLREKNGKRFFQTETKGMYFAKNRGGMLNDTEPANLTELFNKIRGNDNGTTTT